MKKTTELNRALLALAAGRVVLGIAALPMAKFLYKEHFLWLVLMRPTKEVFLAGAFLASRQERPGLMLQILLAALPMSLLGVWLFYYLGRLNCGDLKEGRLSGLAARILPEKKINNLEKILAKKGRKLVFLARMAAFPSSMVGAAAGVSDMPSSRFLPADALGALAAMIEVMGLGYLLGSLFDQSNPRLSWVITGLGVAALFGLLFLLGRYLRREGPDTPA